MYINFNRQQVYLVTSITGTRYRVISSAIQEYTFPNKSQQPLGNILIALTALPRPLNSHYISMNTKMIL